MNHPKPYTNNPNRVRCGMRMSPTERLVFEAVCRVWSELNDAVTDERGVLEDGVGRYPTATQVVNEINRHSQFYDYGCWEPRTYTYTFTTGPYAGETEERHTGGIPSYGTIRCRLRDLTIKGKLHLAHRPGPRQFIPTDEARLELAEYFMPFLAPNFLRRS